MIFIPWKNTRTGLKPGVQLYGLVVALCILKRNVSLTQMSCQSEAPSAQQLDIGMTVTVRFVLVRGSGDHLWLWGKAGISCQEALDTSSSPRWGGAGQQHLLQDLEPGPCSGTITLLQVSSQELLGTSNLFLGPAKGSSWHV